jgi:hypothetical protein
MPPKKVVIFGPFVGEFGWELLFWQGWVKKACRELYVDHYKVAVSYPGRGPFYPDVDEFIPLPDYLFTTGLSARNYICDGWIDGFPGSALSYRWNFINAWKDVIQGKRPHKTAIEKKWEGPSIFPLVSTFCDELDQKFSSNAEVHFVSPWRMNEIGGLHFGWRNPSDLTLYGRSNNVTKIEFKDQILERIHPIGEYKHQYIGSKSKVAVFPRKRGFRREDKNWGEDKYRKLIGSLQDSGYEVAILGDKNGAYFVNNPPNGVVDLVNIEDSERLNTHLHYLTNASYAIGAMSGATLMALAAGTPTVIFGYPNEQMRYHYENYLNTPLFYISEMDPTVNEVINAVNKLAAYIKWQPFKDLI